MVQVYKAGRNTRISKEGMAGEQVEEGVKV